MGKQKVIRVILTSIMLIFISTNCFASFSIMNRVLNRIVINPKSLREEYKFRIGDKIDIMTDIEGRPTDSTKYIILKTEVDRSGYILFTWVKPFAIYVEGRTIKEVEDKIQECFKMFYQHPSVCINVKYAIDFILERYIQEIYEQGQQRQELTEIDIIKYRELIKSLLKDEKDK